MLYFYIARIYTFEVPSDPLVLMQYTQRAETLMMGSEGETMYACTWHGLICRLYCAIDATYP